MMGILTIFEDGIEKAFGKIFPVSKNIRISDLARMICREVQDHKYSEDGRAFVPHLLSIQLSPELIDQLNIKELDLRNQIQRALHSMIKTRGYEVEKPFDVRIQVLKEIKPGTFQIIVGETNLARSIIKEPPEKKAPTKNEYYGCLSWGVRKIYLIPDGAPLPEKPLPAGVKIIQKNKITVGRKYGSGGPFDVELEDTSVSGSKAHAVIHVRNDEYTLEDNNSANGTYVNDQKISNDSLQDNDEIKIGRTAIKFNLKRY